jgi:hypothetical protein
MRVQRRLVALAACSFLSTSISVTAYGAPDAPAQTNVNTQAQSIAMAAPSASAPANAGAAAVPATPPTNKGKVAPGVRPAAEPAMGPDEHARRLQSALHRLRGSDPVAIQEALSSLQELQGRAAAEAIVARVQAGLPPQLAERALEVLSGLSQPLAAPVLSELTQHRRWQIRAQAVRALGVLRVRSSVSVLLYALDDPSPEVRSAAARALGMAGDPRALRALDAALAKNVDGALEGLAGLVPSKQLDVILARAKTNLNASEPALWVLLTRANLPVVSKLKVMNFVIAHDSEQEADQVLALWKSKLKESGDVRLLTALVESEKRAAGAPAAKAVVSAAPAVKGPAAPSTPGAEP